MITRNEAEKYIALQLIFYHCYHSQCPDITWRGVTPKVLYFVHIIIIIIIIIIMRQTSQCHCLGELKHSAGNAVPDCTTKYKKKKCAFRNTQQGDYRPLNFCCTVLSHLDTQCSKESVNILIFVC